jgi:serine-type D-Ala-D-Ala carboxypeptidase/endopeptidase (penicillin-binding protein 4)
VLEQIITPYYLKLPSSNCLQLKYQKCKFYWIYLFLFTFLSIVIKSELASCSDTPADILKIKQLVNLSEQRRNRTGLILVKLKDKQTETLFTYRSMEAFKPASILKLFTTWTALNLFTPTKQFSLDFKSDTNTANVKTLYVSGEGDPALTSEALWLLSRALYVRGLRKAEKVIIDKSLSSFTSYKGSEPFEAPVSGLSLNYNSKTTFSCFMNGKMINIPELWETNFNHNFSYQFRIGGPTLNCKPIYNSVVNPLENFLKSFSSIAKSINLSIPDTYQTGNVTNNSIRYKHLSEPLDSIIRRMNYYSNNIIAEQLTRLIGGGIYSNGLSKLNKNITLFSKDRNSFSYDGSGLSHKNSITANAVINLLITAYYDPRLSIAFQASLPTGGQTGTLKNFKFSSYGGSVNAKTGTLNGVSSLAGYLQHRNRDKYAFVIIQQGSFTKNQAQVFERSLIETVLK